MDMRERGLFDHTSKRVSRLWLNSPRDEFPERRGRALVRNWMKSFPIIDHQSTKRRLAQCMSFFEDRLEHRREIAGRGVDDTQHFGRGRLLLQRLAGFGNEPRILHRYDRLRGEVLEERDLSVGKRADFCSIDDEVTKKCIVLAQSYCQQGAATSQLHKIAADRIASPVRFVVRNIS